MLNCIIIFKSEYIAKNGPNNIAIIVYTIAIFGTIVKNAVIIVFTPSYTSGAQL
jgi:hypothetical protein